MNKKKKEEEQNFKYDLTSLTRWLKYAVGGDGKHQVGR